MVRLATFFTGLGPMEYAMKRLDVKHESIIACDNSDCATLINIQEHKKSVRNMKSIDAKIRRISRIRNKPRRLKTHAGVKRHRVTRHYMREIYEINFPNHSKYYIDDIVFVDGRDFRDKIDFIYGSVPDISYVVEKRLGGVDDIPRDSLLFEYIRMIREIQPKVFMVQFTRNMMHHDKQKYMNRIKSAFVDIGYHIKLSRVNALDCNIPQSRTRVFIVGFLDEDNCDKFSFPEPRELEYTMRDFLLYDTPIGNFNYNKDGSLNIVHEKQSKETLMNMDKEYKKLYLSESMRNFVLAPDKGHMSKMMKPNNETALTIISLMQNSQRAHVDNYVSDDGVSQEVGKIRKLHQREVFRLMGFCDDYDISCMSRTRCYYSCGSSTVVDVLMELVKAIGKVMDWEKNDGTKF